MSLFLNRFHHVCFSQLIKVVSKSASKAMIFADVVSYFYTVAWSISFYGQIYINCKLKSVEGMSLDFLALNICGFVFYSLYSTIGFFFPHIKGAGTVVLADLLFAYHALAMVLLWLVQAYFYPHGKNRLSRRAIYICLAFWSLVGIQTLLTCVFKIMPWNDYINPVSSLGYCKVGLTLIKYIPVAYWNYVRKSTVGWSIFGVLTDLIGGVLSLISGLLLTHNGMNMGKLGLALISIAFDSLFTTQHFCIYPQKKEKKKEQEKFYEMNEVDNELGTEKNGHESNSENKLQKKESKS